MATLVSSIVDTDGTGDYLSLNAADSADLGATSKDLVANDEYVVVDCQCSSGSADTAQYNLSGYTTDADRYVKIWCDPNSGYRFTDSLDSSNPLITNKFRLNPPCDNGNAEILIAHLYLEGLQLTTSGSWNLCNISDDISDTTAFCESSECFFEGPNVSNALLSVGYRKNTIYNNIFSNTSDKAIRLENSLSNSYLMNCVEYNTDGFRCSYDGINAYNNVGNFKTYGATWQGDYNISYDDSAPGSNSIINESATNIFNDPANNDFHLLSDGPAVDAGTDMSTYMDAVDITGTSRPRGNAWDIGAFEYVSAAGLTFDSIIQGQTVVSPTLAQLQSLGISSVAQSQTVDSPDISQIHAITTNAIKQGQTIDSLSLQQMISLAIDAINQGQNVDSLTISQLVSLTVNSVSQGQLLEEPSIALLGQLTIDSINQGQSVSQLTLQQVIQLTINGINQGQTIDQATVSQLQQLAVDSVKQSQSIDSLTVDQLISLTINNISQDQLVNSPTLTLPGELVINSIIQGQNVVSPTLQQAQGLLDVANITQGQSVSALSLEQAHSLITDSVNQGQSIDTTNLDQLISLAIDSVSQGQTLSEPSLYSVTVLNIDSIQQGQTVETTDVSQVSQLIIDEISQGQVIENINFSIAKGRLQITITGKKPGVNFDGKAPTTRFQ